TTQRRPRATCPLVLQRRRRAVLLCLALALPAGLAGISASRPQRPTELIAMPVTFAIDIRQLGPVGFVARVVEVLTSGLDGDEVYCTRIYGSAEDAAFMARQWIEENREP